MKNRIIQPTMYIKRYNISFSFYDHSEIKIKPCSVNIAKPSISYSPKFYPLQSQAFDEYDRRVSENIKVL